MFGQSPKQHNMSHNRTLRELPKIQKMVVLEARLLVTILPVQIMYMLYYIYKLQCICIIIKIKSNQNNKLLTVKSNRSTFVPTVPIFFNCATNMATVSNFAIIAIFCFLLLFPFYFIIIIIQIIYYYYYKYKIKQTVNI